MMKAKMGLEKSLSLMATVLTVLSFLMLAENAYSSSEKAIDGCITSEPKYVSEACDYFNAAYPDCETTIDAEFIAEGHANPNVSVNDTIGDIADDTGIGQDEVTSLVCHGGSSGGGGGGN